MSAREKPNSLKTDHLDGPEYPIGVPATVTPFLSATSLLSFNAFEAGMRNWRTLMDSTRNLMRLQQDAMIEMTRAQFAGVESNASPQRQLTESFHTAAQMYERMGSAWLDAQQSALDSLTHSDVRH